jgi:hypothetical protein
MLNGWLAWLIGVPSLIIILLWLVGSLRWWATCADALDLCGRSSCAHCFSP